MELKKSLRGCRKGPAWKRKTAVSSRLLLWQLLQPGHVVLWCFYALEVKALWNLFRPKMLTSHSHRPVCSIIIVHVSFCTRTNAFFFFLRPGIFQAFILFTGLLESSKCFWGFSGWTLIPVFLRIEHIHGAFVSDWFFGVFWGINKGYSASSSNKGSDDVLALLWLRFLRLSA